jgi:hypothetical protein
MVVPLMSLSLRSRVAVLDPRSGDRATIFELGEGRQAALSPDGRELALLSAGRDVRFVDLATGRITRVPDDAGPRHSGTVASYDALYSPDGSYLLTWDGQGRAVFRDGQTGRYVRTIDVNQECVFGFAFSPDGLWLATGGADGRVAVWDVVAGDRVWDRAGHPNVVNSVGFAGLRRLVTGARDLTALVWDLRPDEKTKRPAWDALSGPDARAAYQAMWAIADDPAGPALVRAKIPPARPPAPERVRQLIADLAATRYAVREAASIALSDLGRLAEPELRAARAGTADEEVRTRLDGILSQLRRGRASDEIIRARAVAAMELAGTPAAKKVLAEWAAGALGARLTMDAREAMARLGDR